MCGIVIADRNFSLADARRVSYRGGNAIGRETYEGMHACHFLWLPAEPGA